MKDNELYWLWLSSLTEVSLNAKAALLEVFGSPEAAFFSPKGAFAHIEGISQREAVLLEERDLTAAEAIPALCAAQDIRLVTFDNRGYPQRLKEIYAPPSVLYVRGSLPDLDAELPVAVIGTRHASDYGLRMGRNIAYELSKCGAVVVSLLTAGVDAAAAEGALAAGGICVGVLGTAIDAARSSLAKRVCREGALISEYAPGTKPAKYLFPRRNRIIAALSDELYVIDAGRNSGTRSTVAFCERYGRRVRALPEINQSEEKR